jgi:hypothetical protein
MVHCLLLPVATHDSHSFQSGRGATVAVGQLDIQQYSHRLVPRWSYVRASVVPRCAAALPTPAFSLPWPCLQVFKASVAALVVSLVVAQNPSPVVNTQYGPVQGVGTATVRTLVPPSLFPSPHPPPPSSPLPFPHKLMWTADPMIHSACPLHPRALP